MTLIDALSRVKTVMDIEPLQDGDKGLKPLEGSIELRNVSFRYKDAAAYVECGI
jgi:ATP-binding cassette subfamily B protein